MPGTGSSPCVGIGRQNCPLQWVRLRKWIADVRAKTDFPPFFPRENNHVNKR